MADAPTPDPAAPPEPAQAEPPAPTPEPPPPAADKGKETPEPAPEGLGDAGKKALAQERDARKAAEKQLKDAEKELAALREAQMSEQERAVAEARREGETATTTAFQRRLFAAEAKVAAAGKVADPTLLADPDVALRLLGFKEIPVDEAGDIDPEAISGAIDRLVEGRPFLKAGQPEAHATWPSNGSEAGPRGDATSQLTRDDLKSMKPEEITKARADGRLDRLLGKT